MSVATAATSTKRQIRSSLRKWRGDLEEDLLPLFRDFVTDTLGRLRGPFLAHHHAKQVLEYLEKAFLFAFVRKSQGVQVVIERGASKGLIVLCSMDDQPFIVDTIRLHLKNGGAEHWGGFNVVFNATRDAEGRLVAIGDEQHGTPESLVLVEAEAGRLGDDLERSAKQLTTNLELSRALVEDFKPMTRVIERFVEKLEVRADRHPEKSDDYRETAAFLQWLLRENFVFMGVDYGDEPLGIQRLQGAYYGTPEGDWPPPHPPETVRVRKSRIESPVHRAGRIDEILVTIDGAGDNGDPVLFIRGMFTYRAVTQPCRHVPILRRVLASILEDIQSKPGSFRYKGIANVFDSLPTEFLFTASRQAIADTVDLVFESEQQHEVAVSFLMTGPHSAFCLVAMPKGHFGDELRRSLEEYIVTTLKATYSDHGLFVGRYDTVLLYYYLTGVENPGEEGLVALTDHIRSLATPWLARLWQSLVERFDETTADRLTDAYGRAFSEDYVRNTPALRAVRDIERMESLSDAQTVVADLFEQDGGLILRLYEDQDVYLSDILPILDDFGLVVIDGYASEVKTREDLLFIDTFHLEGAKNLTNEAILAQRDLLTRAIEASFSGKVGSDPMNQLVLAAGLAWAEVDVLRGYARYARQFQFPLSQARITELLLSHPKLCAILVRLFHAKFDPDAEGDREVAIEEARAELTDALRHIRTHDEDLIFSTLREFVEATVRTNFYRDDKRFHYLSFKLDCSKVRLMGASRPMFEIYVHHKDVEGVHLRFGKVARGGLRWSDRDDYRTEVLGLATTQVVKNVVIVPVGAKGGFYLKNASRDPKQRRAEADHHYKTFIRGLLDLTDNAKDGVPVPPARVVRHDPDDPYLVVAADKGTAHLSDTANSLSKEYGFWLGDAFASGGSNGYDHKKVGITARGGWVLAARHFMEMGRDPYAETFTCAGVGDMGGDVFGNGLIETPHCKLLAAFNHVHVFLDPDPDPKVSYEERVRLFKAGPRDGGWDNYDKKLISAGGGVFDRAGKTIPLSPEAQEMLGLHQSEAGPEEVIRHILKMGVDLMWNGGIGTYVKASTETNADVGDRSNDALRVNADELRCRVVGEGGNLGMTQKARIEAALHGVALNTDFIDNSGGVDMSDHEVNLKILLDRVVDRGDMTEPERNVLLEQMTDEVAQLVLADNAAQGRQLSRDRIRSTKNIWHFGRAIEFVERTSGRPRAALDLPTGKELQRRADLGLGLTRPELSVLSSYVKMYVFGALMSGTPKELPGYEQLLTDYFPKTMQEKWPEDIRRHMLADEIAMTVATTKIVADAGAAFIPVALETTGRSVQEICGAYLKAQVLSKAAEVRATMEQLRSSVRLNDLSRAWVAVDEGTRSVAGYWLSAGERPPTETEMRDMLASVDEVYRLQASEVAKKNEDLLDEMLKAQIPREVASRVLKAQYLSTALSVWSEAKRLSVPLRDMVVQNLAVARATGLQDVIDDLATRAAVGRWDPIALHILYRRFTKLLRQTVIRTPIEGAAKTVDEAAPVLRRKYLGEIRDTVDELLRGEGPPSVATLVVLEERLEGALARLPGAS